MDLTIAVMQARYIEGDVCGVKICNVYVVNGNPVDSAAFLYRQVPCVYVSGLSLCVLVRACMRKARSLRRLLNYQGHVVSSLCAPRLAS